jgi:hypothetical protein
MSSLDEGLHFQPRLRRVRSLACYGTFWGEAVSGVAVAVAVALEFLYALLLLTCFGGAVSEPGVRAGDRRLTLTSRDMIGGGRAGGSGDRSAGSETRTTTGLCYFRSSDREYFEPRLSTLWPCLISPPLK